MGTKATLIADFRAIAKDSESELLSVDTWLDSALAKINMMRPHIRATASFDPDGSSYIFDLSTLTKFFLLKRAYLKRENVVTNLIKHVHEMDYIRRLEANSGVVGGFPVYYAMEDKETLYVDATMVAVSSPTALDAEKLWIRYLKTPTALDGDDDQPEGDLASGWDELILARMGLDNWAKLSDAIGIRFRAFSKEVWDDPRTLIQGGQGFKAFKEHAYRNGYEENDDNYPPVQGVWAGGGLSVNIHDVYVPDFSE